MNRSLLCLVITAPLVAGFGCQPGQSSQSNTLTGPDTDLAVSESAGNKATIWVKGMG